MLGRPVRFGTVNVHCGRREKAAEETAPTSAKPGTDRRSVAGRSGKLDLSPVPDGRLVVRSDQAAAVIAAVDLAKKEIYFHGLATVERIQRAISARFGERAGMDLVRQVLLLIDGFCWLDEPSGWFRLQPLQRHGLPKAIDKVLSVAGTVTAGQLHTALSRNRRLWKEPPPENVLLEFCRQMPRVRVEGDRIISDPPRDWRKALTGVEAKLVERAQGPRPGDGTRRDGRPLRGRRHEPLQLPRLRLLVAGDRPVRPQRLRPLGQPK